MKKTQPALQKKPLRLSRETIQILNDPALELARGGVFSGFDSCDTHTIVSTMPGC